MAAKARLKGSAQKLKQVLKSGAKPVAKLKTAPKRPSKPPSKAPPAKPPTGKTPSSPPGSERPLAVAGLPPKATVRTPERAEELKAKIGALASATNQIRALKRSLNKSFYEIGQILGDIQSKKLYEVKGYSTFEAFVEREIDLGKQLSLRIVRIAQTFLRDAALAAGLERVSAGLAAMENDGEATPQQPGSNPPPSAGAAGARSAVPFHKQ